MKKLMRNKKFIAVITILIVLAVLCLTGCNQQVIDLNYTYDKAICNINGTYQEIEIKKWNDYEGEQLQIIDKEGNVYLSSSYNCTLIKEN